MIHFQDMWFTVLSNPTNRFLFRTFRGCSKLCFPSPLRNTHRKIGNLILWGIRLCQCRIAHISYPLYFQRGKKLRPRTFDGISGIEACSWGRIDCTPGTCFSAPPYIFHWDFRRFHRGPLFQQWISSLRPNRRHLGWECEWLCRWVWDQAICLRLRVSIRGGRHWAAGRVVLSIHVGWDARGLTWASCFYLRWNGQRFWGWGTGSKTGRLLLAQHRSRSFRIHREVQKRSSSIFID